MRNIIDILDTLYSSSSVINGVYISGEAGNSKSWNVEKYLKEKNVVYTKITARVTNLALYMLLYKHKNETIVLDDVVMDKIISIDLLKSALNNDGLVSWYTSSDKFEDELPKSFEFKGKIIIITNQSINENRNFYPLLSRCHFLEQNLTLLEYREIAKYMCGLRNVSFEIIDNYLSMWLKHRDLRIINKACDYLLAGKQNLIPTLFDEDEELKKLDELIKLYAKDKLLIRKQWCAYFDLSKRTFYNRLKVYNARVQECNEKRGGLNGI